MPISDRARRLVRELRIELSKDVLHRRRIYLDTRFWIFLRDAFLERSADAVHRELLTVLAQGVESGTMICPIEASTFIELHRQSDPSTRRATVGLIDRLSKAVGLIPARDRAWCELVSLLERREPQARLEHRPRDLVWTRVGNLFGDFFPTNPAFDSATNADLQVQWIQRWWARTLTDLLDRTGFNLDLPVWDTASLAAKTNRAKDAHASEIRSFQQALRNEARGMCDAHFQEMAAALAHVSAAEPQPTTIDGNERVLRMFTNLVVEGVARGSFGADLPTIDIPSRIHAAMRWDRERRYQATDWLDIEHATAAVGYCDVFLTERSLAWLLSERLKLPARYGTMITSSPHQALEFLRSV